MRSLNTMGHVALSTTLTLVSLSITSAAAVHMKFPNIIPRSNHHTSASSHAPQSTNPFATKPSWQQIFSNQPNGALDPSTWKFEQGNNDGWGNNEIENYTSDPGNVRIENGNLVIDAHKDGSTYTSARITTQGSLDIMYGKLDIVAKLPVGQGIWPAVWLWPTDNKYSETLVPKAKQDVAWLSNGEIDILEGSAQGDNDFSGSVHSVNHNPEAGERTGTVTVPTATTRYHTYSIAWTPSQLQLLVDNIPFETVKNSGKGFMDWPYDQRYHLILNIALGGTQSQNLKTSEMPDGVDDASGPWHMQVQSITYYPLAKQ